jgi:cell division protein FtsW
MAPTRTRARTGRETAETAEPAPEPSRRELSARTQRRQAKRARLAEKRSGRGFLVLLAIVIVLNLVGLVMVLSASQVTALHDYGSSWYYFIRQLMWVGIGLVAFVVTIQVDYRKWRRIAVPLLGVSLVLLVLVLVAGTEVTGSQHWLGIGDLRIQPSELAKLALLVFAADLLARRSDQMHRTEITLRPILVILVLFAGLVLLQPNLGTTLIMTSIVLVLLFVAGTPLRSVGSVVGLGLGGAVVLAIVAPYRRDRLLAFLDPWADPQNTGYQLIQSRVAIASGGLTGRGLGASRAKWEFLPFAHTDFIFAVISEELGLVGAALVLALFVAFGVFGISVALRAPDSFGMLLAAGVTAWIMVQAFVNIGAVLGVLPITGVPLPFVSFGGSSMLVTMVAAGLLLNVARQAR